MRVTVRDPSSNVIYQSKVVWNRKIITEFARSISSTMIGERTSSMLDEIASKTAQRRKAAVDSGKRSKTLNEVKLGKIINMSPQSFPKSQAK